MLLNGSIFFIEHALEKALSDAEGFFVACGNRAGEAVIGP